MSKETSEILNITLEECAEVTQAIAKVFRFGWDSCHPSTPNYSNKEHLEEEIGDLLCMIEILHEKKYVNGDSILRAIKAKREKLKRWSDIKV